MGQQHVVGGAQGGLCVAQAGGVSADLVAQNADAPRLVVGDPVLDPVAQGGADHAGVLDERLGRGPRRPAAGILEGLWQIPVVKGDEGRDVGRQQAVNQPAVELQPGLIDPAAAVGQDARPGDGEAVGAQAERLHQFDVLRPAVVVVAGDVAGVPLENVARRVGEAIPDRLPFAVLVPGALDLVRGRRRAPHKVARK